MNALTAFIIAPAIVAFLRGQGIFWCALATLLATVAYFMGSPGTAAAIWLGGLIYAVLR